MQNLEEPSFFLTKTMFDAQGLLDGSMTFRFSISSMCSSTSFCMCGGIRLVACFIGALPPVSILCLIMSVLPKSLSDVANGVLYLKSNWSTVFFYLKVTYPDLIVQIDQSYVPVVPQLYLFFVQPFWPQIPHQLV